MGRGPIQSEAEVLRDCCEFLDWLRASYKITYRRITTTGVPARVSGGRVIFRKNKTAGMADLLVFLSTQYVPRTVHIEVKSTNGSWSKTQKAWADELASCGHLDYFVVRSREELAEIMKLHYGIELGGEWTTRKR